MNGPISIYFRYWVLVFQLIFHVLPESAKQLIPIKLGLIFGYENLVSNCRVLKQRCWLSKKYRSNHAYFLRMGFGFFAALTLNSVICLAIKIDQIMLTDRIWKSGFSVPGREMTLSTKLQNGSNYAHFVGLKLWFLTALSWNTPSAKQQRSIGLVLLLVYGRRGSHCFVQKHRCLLIIKNRSNLTYFPCRNSRFQLLCLETLLSAKHYRSTNLSPFPACGLLVSHCPVSKHCCQLSFKGRSILAYSPQVEFWFPNDLS